MQWCSGTAEPWERLDTALISSDTDICWKHGGDLNASLSHTADREYSSLFNRPQKNSTNATRTDCLCVFIYPPQLFKCYILYFLMTSLFIFLLL